jgi:hypothetical protein
MGFRLFDQLDVINITEGYTVGPFSTNSSGVLSNTQFSNFQIVGSGFDATPGGSSTQYHATYRKEGNVDFSIFPRVPLNALINKVVLRNTSSVAVTLTSVNTLPGFGCNASLTTGSATYSSVVSESQVQDHNCSIIKTFNESGILSTTVFDPPITYAQLVVSYSPIALEIALELSASAQPNFVTVANASIDFNASISDWSIEVSWEDNFKWTLDGTPPIDVGSPIEVTSNPLNEPLNMLGIDHIEIQFDDGGPIVITVPSTDFTTWEPFDLIFLMPPFAGHTPPVIRVVAVGDGTQFSGSVDLGELITIYFTNPSGIYKLVIDKTSDTLYVNATNVTVDVKIPDPFAKLSFIP